MSTRGIGILFLTLAALAGFGLGLLLGAVTWGGSDTTTIPIVAHPAAVVSPTTTNHTVVMVPATIPTCPEDAKKGSSYPTPCLHSVITIQQTTTH